MTFLLALFGLFVGGLVNQLASDLPARRQLTRPHCRYCGQNRPWWQWLSLPASLLGRDKCLHCGAPVRLRLPLTEIGMAVTYAYLWILLGPSGKLPLYLVYFAILAVILITDLEWKLILHVVTFPSILFAFAASFITPDMVWWNALIGGAIGFFFFLITVVAGNIIFKAKEGAMGEGDITLATFVGLITGFPLIIEALVLTLVIGAVVSLVLLVIRKRGLHDYVPYGPFLVAGAAITLLWGYPIAEWLMYR